MTTLVRLAAAVALFAATGAASALESPAAVMAQNDPTVMMDVVVDDRLAAPAVAPVPLARPLRVARAPAQERVAPVRRARAEPAVIRASLRAEPPRRRVAAVRVEPARPAGVVRPIYLTLGFGFF